MTTTFRPEHFTSLASHYPECIAAMDAVAAAARASGPLEEQTLQLVQLAAAAALGSEAAVGCHACGAVLAGASPDAINQMLLSLIPLIGLPAVATAFKWTQLHIDE